MQNFSKMGEGWGGFFFAGRGDGIFFIRMGGAIEKWARMVHKEEKYNQEVECRL